MWHPRPEETRPVLTPRDSLVAVSGESRGKFRQVPSDWAFEWVEPKRSKKPLISSESERPGLSTVCLRALHKKHLSFLCFTKSGSGPRAANAITMSNSGYARVAIGDDEAGVAV